MARGVRRRNEEWFVATCGPANAGNDVEGLILRRCWHYLRFNHLKSPVASVYSYHCRKRQVEIEISLKHTHPVVPAPLQAFLV